MSIKKVLGIAVAAWLLLSNGIAQSLSLPLVICDNMVIQRDKPVRIFGKAQPLASVSVAFASQLKTGAADAAGDFMIMLDAETVSATPRTMTVSSGEENIVLQNILVGDVFLCSGQSNMAFKVKQLTPEARSEIAADSDYPNVRYTYVTDLAYQQDGYSIQPDIPWTALSSADEPFLSGIAFYFARQLYKDKNIPVGVIDCSRGSSNADAWISLAYYDAHPELIPYRNGFTSSGEYKYFANPGALYTSMLSRVMPYTVKAFLWYQGESNSSTYYRYSKIFPALIDFFRESWSEPAMPFIFAQLSAYDHPAFWPPVREVQDSVARTIANTAMISTIDVGERSDIHPKNKKTPGERFEKAVRNLVYGESINYSGPSYKSIRFEGKKAIIGFDYADGLHSKGTITGELEICGDNYCYAPATGAEIAGNELHVWNDAVSQPKAVRYAWKNFPTPNLYNSDNLPANPFRTTTLGAITVYVSPTGNDDNAGTAANPLKTIKRAINMLSDFQETTIILEKDAIFEESGITINRNKVATLVGNNSTIQAAPEKQSQAADRILSIDLYSSVKLRNIIFKNGYRHAGTDNPTNSGGAIYFGGTMLEIDSCRFIDNVAAVHGGAIASYGGELKINHSYFEGSVSVAGYGGAITHNGLADQTNTLRIYNSTFNKNKTLITTDSYLAMGSAVHVHNGGGICSHDVDIANSVFIENTCPKSYIAALDIGAGITTKTYITNNTFLKNSETAVRIDGVGNQVFFSNNVIAGGLYGISTANATQTGSSRRNYAIEGYNNVLYSSSRVVGGSVDDAAFNESKTGCNNQIVTSSNYSALYLNNALTFDDTFAPYLSVTNEASTLINYCTKELSYSTGVYNAPSSDIRGLKTVGTRDAGAYEYGATETNIQALSANTGIRVYPNPGKEILNLTGIPGEGRMLVFNLSGIRISEQPLASTVNIAMLMPGIYVLKIETDSQAVQYVKFIKV